MSKLIELMLAADIKWPAGAKFAVQRGNELWVYKNQPEYDDDTPDWCGLNGTYLFRLPERCNNWTNEIVTAQEYYIAGGWVEYNAGKADLVLQPSNHDILYDSGYTNLNPSDDIDFSAARCYRLIQQPGLYDIHVDPVVIEPVEPVIRPSPMSAEQITKAITHVNGKFDPTRLYTDGKNTGYVAGVSIYDGATVMLDLVEDGDMSGKLVYADAGCLDPVLTEREKAIRDMVKILKRFDCSPYEIAEALVDTGYHK